MSYRETVWWVALIGALLQIGALVFLYDLFGSKSIERVFWLKLTFRLVITAFTIKIVLQALSVLSVAQILAFNIKNMVLAYLHLCLLGVLSFGIIWLFLKLGIIRLNLIGKLALLLLVFGFITTEILLVTSSLMLAFSQLGLAIASASMAAGILLLILNITMDITNGQND